MAVEVTRPGRSQIDCPRAKSWMTPCIARDGNLALADDKTCVGCWGKPFALLRDLADRYPPAGEHLQIRSPGAAADRLRDCVAAYVATMD
jgi:hypothetical protein